MPRLTPDTAEAMEIALMATINASCVPMPASRSVRRLRPTAIWLTPRPSEVAIPNTQPSTPMISTAWPIGP